MCKITLLEIPNTFVNQSSGKHFQSFLSQLCMECNYLPECNIDWFSFIREMDYKCNSLCNPWILYSSGIKWGPRLWGSWDYIVSAILPLCRYKQTCKTLCISYILNNTWSMPAQSGIHPQLRTMILLTMCKGLPVEYLSKCGTVNVLRCWTLWTCPAWKPGGKPKVLFTIQHALGECDQSIVNCS